MNNTGWALVVLGVFIVGAGGYYLLSTSEVGESVDIAGPGAINAPQPSAPARMPEPRSPVSATVRSSSPEDPVATAPAPTAMPLPALQDSDEPLLADARPLFGAQGMPSFLVPKDLIARVVVTLDNLDRLPIREGLQPVRRVPGKPAVQGRAGAEDEKLYLTAANTQRYAPYVGVLEQLQPAQVATLYQRYSPLFQKAYKNLGYPRAKFDERLSAIIDHLLATPVVEYPIPVVRPKVFYEFADPALEERSWGQKTLIRLGSEQMATVKAFLRALRAELANT